ncbi:Zn(II)2Cys6 transcription factor domain-containing protein [Rhodotorula paludigena]|uniref:Zn(II)2Cys6 transcription factor domain-containing protein n=1 Tax=Rhodotorula paludigena TaxID=86838 RepID=UPI00316D47A3
MRRNDPPHRPLAGAGSGSGRPVYTPYSFLPPGASSAFGSSAALYPPVPAAAGQVASMRQDQADESMLPSPPISTRTSSGDPHTLASMSTAISGGAFVPGEGEMGSEDVLGAGGSSSQPPKIIQKADRSCKKCRERRVRCGREYPTCSRCKKRRDACNYGEGVYVEETVEGSDQQRIADLEGKISSLQSQLRAGTSSSSRHSTAGASHSSPSPLSRSSLACDIARVITEALSLPDQSVLQAFVSEEERNARRPSFSSLDFRLASSGITVALTFHLLDTASRACDSKMPALAGIAARVPVLKSRIHELEPPDVVNVAVLCALGARTSPHCNFFGVASVHGPDGAPSAGLFQVVGRRREDFCVTLERRARDTAWAYGLFRTQTYEGMEALAALMMLSLHEENESEETRWLVRQAVGVFLDMRHRELLSGSTSAISKSAGLAIFLADAQTAVRCSKPTIISPTELQDYWATAGLILPDLSNPRLPTVIDQQIQGSLTHDSVKDLLDTIFFYVYACYRVFAQVTGPARRTESSSILGFIRSLWNLVDQIHNAIQRLQQHLVSLSGPFAGANDDPHAVDHAILLAVLADDVLVHLVGQVHVYLQRDRDTGLYGPEREGHEDLQRTRSESSMRVWKCLKLLAFYCQLYCGSQDKHTVYHLLMQLRPLPNWTVLIASRIGQPGGPPTDEFECSEEEVEWFRMALELSLYYSPRLRPSLDELVSARQVFMHKPAPPQDLPLPGLHHRSTSAHFSLPSTMPPPSLDGVSSPSASSSTLSYNYHPDTPLPSALSTPAGAYELPSASTSFGLADPLPRYSSQDSTPMPQHGSVLSFPFEQHQQAPAVAQQQQQAQPQAAAPHSQPQSPQRPQHTPHLQQQQQHQHSQQHQQQQVAASSGSESSSTGAFADGASDDLAGIVTDVRSAFRSVDWADLSLTPAPMVGSDGSSSSMEDWLRGGMSRPP